MENELKEAQILFNKYKELYTKESADRELNNRSYVYLLKSIMGEDLSQLKGNPMTIINDWVKRANNYKKATTSTRQATCGAITEKEAAELNRLTKEIEKKEMEKKILMKRIEDKKSLKREHKRVEDTIRKASTAMRQKDIIIKKRNIGKTKSIATPRTDNKL
jgi:hypothetical protein